MEPRLSDQQFHELELRLKQLDAERAEVLQAIEKLKADEQLEAKLMEGLNIKESALTATAGKLCGPKLWRSWPRESARADADGAPA